MTRYDGKTTRRRLKKLRLSEISLVDTPAHGPATVAIMKRADDSAAVELQKNRLAMTTLHNGHSHTIVLVSAHAEGMAELKAGQTSFADGHIHDWIMDDAGNILISDADAHSHGLSALVKAADSVSNEDLVESVASLDLNEHEADHNPAASAGDSNEDTNVTTKNEKTADNAVTPEELQKAEQRAERFEQIVKLSPEQRAHFDALPSEKQDEFLASENKDEIVKGAADENAVVYTSRDGDEFRKSDDPRMVKAAQRADAAEERVEKAEQKAKRNELLKRASDELTHLNGEDEAKADLLGAIESLPTEKQAAVLEIVKSKDAGLAKAFETVGTSDDGNGSGTDVGAKLDSLAKSHREKNPHLSPEQAYVAVLRTPEGAELHAQL